MSLPTNLISQHRQELESEGQREFYDQLSSLIFSGIRDDDDVALSDLWPTLSNKKNLPALRRALEVLGEALDSYGDAGPKERLMAILKSPPTTNGSVPYVMRLEASDGAGKLAGTLQTAVLQPQLPLVSSDKASSSEAFGAFFGIKGIALHDYGTLPLGRWGEKLVALRLIIANGGLWNKYFNWKANLEKAGATPKQLTQIKDLISGLKGLQERFEKEGIRGRKPADYFKFFLNLARSKNRKFTKEMIEFLVLCQISFEFRESARTELRNQAQTLFAKNPKVLDLLYLATFDLKTYPAQTVTAGSLKHVIVADKGEMAVRLVREAVALNKIPVVVYNINDDANSLQVRLAKAHGGMVIGLEGDFKASYASFEQISDRVIASFKKKFGARYRAELARAALHPGYGPLAENSEAIQYFRQRGIAFIGPMQDVVESLGDKRAFRKIIQSIAEKFVTPGITIDSNNADEIYFQIVEAYQRGEFTLPGRLKAANGGGGRGQKVVHSPDELRAAIDFVRNQIETNGWTPGVMFEQNIPETIHLEVQVIADRYGNIRILGMRDCTVQRDGQKIQEEASPKILEKYPWLYNEIYRVVMEAARKAGYAFAGTFELMFKDGKVSFLETNTRIQVEVPVTEESHVIVRPDGRRESPNVVQQQIQIADGKPLDYEQKDVEQDYTSKEFRINAESWKPNIKNPRDGKMGVFLPNAGIIDKISIPSKDDVLAYMGANGFPVEEIDGIKIRVESGFEEGDLLVNKDPTFLKLIISAKTKNKSKDHEMLRLVSMAVFDLLKIEGRQVDPKGQVVIDRQTEKPVPFETNVVAHQRFLKSLQMRWHAAGIHKGWHVGWAVAAFREGENLDASPYPPLMRQSYEELSLPTVYAIHRADPNQVSLGEDHPVVFTQPESYKGLLALYLENLKTDGKIDFQRLFSGHDFSKGNYRVGASIDIEGKVIHASLFQGDRPVSVLITLEVMNTSQLLKVDLHYESEGIQVAVENLTMGGATTFTIPKKRNHASFQIDPVRHLIPGLDQEFEFIVEMKNGDANLDIRNQSGDKIIHLRPHTAKGFVNQYFYLLEKLNDLTLSDVDRKETRASLQQIFIDMAVVSGLKTTTRVQFVKQLAHSPHSLTTEISLMALYKNADNSELEKRVRGFADEILFYRYYDTRFHHIRKYETIERITRNTKTDTTNALLIGLGTFDDDETSLIHPAPIKDRHVAWLKLSPTNAQWRICRALSAAVRELQKRWGDITNDAVEIMISQSILDDDEFADFLNRIVNEVLGQTIIRRVTFIIYQKNGQPAFQPGDGFFTFRPTGRDGPLYEESIKYDAQYAIVPRHEHPMVSEQLERWRWADFASRHVPSKHRLVHVTEVVANKNPADRRYIINSQIRETVGLSLLDGDLFKNYIFALVRGENAKEILAAWVDPTSTNVPVDLPERLENLFRWALFDQKILSHVSQEELKDLYQQGIITDEHIETICKALDQMPYYSFQIEAGLAQLIVELKRLMEAEKDPATRHLNNRIQLFVQTPIGLNRAYASFMGYHLLQDLESLQLEKISIHSQQGILLLSGSPRGPNYASLVEASPERIEPKTTHDMRVYALHETGNLTPAEQAEIFFDDGEFNELQRDKEGWLTEKEYDPNHKQPIRGFVGRVGGSRTYFIIPDIVNPRKGLSFDAPDGELIKAIIDHSYAERDEAGNLVGAPLYYSEEFSSGANLFDKTNPNWAATTPLDQFGLAFEARYNHARESGRPNVTGANNMIVGGGIYGPKGSHDVLFGAGHAIAALTGGNAAGYATGGKPRLDERGQLKPTGGSAQFNERADGSTAIHGANGVASTIVTTPEIERLVREGVPVHELERRLSPSGKRELKGAIIHEARERILILDNNPESLLKKAPNRKDRDRPIASFKTYLDLLATDRTASMGAFIPVLMEMALKDRTGAPLVKIWNENFGMDLLTAWGVLPVEQEDGTIKAETVAFMVTREESSDPSEVDSPINRKAEEFLEINSRLGRSMVIFSATGRSETHRVLFGKRAQTQLANYQAPLYSFGVSGNEETFFERRVQQNIQDGQLEEALGALSDEKRKSPLPILTNISSHLAQSRKNKIFFKNVIRPLEQRGIEFQIIRDEKDIQKSRIVIGEKMVDADALTALLHRIARFENLAFLAQKEIEITSDGGVLINGIEYSDPADFFAVSGILHLLGVQDDQLQLRLRRGRKPSKGDPIFLRSDLGVNSEIPWVVHQKGDDITGTHQDFLRLGETELGKTQRDLLMLNDQWDGLLQVAPTREAFDHLMISFNTYVHDEIFEALQTGDTQVIQKISHERYGKPIPSFIPVLEDMALKDRQGRPLLKIWKENVAADLLTAWVALPLEQPDGSIQAKTVAFMMNDPSGPTRGAIMPEACLKAEEFLEINSRQHRPMVRFAGSPGFLATKEAEKRGIEQFGKRAMDKVISYEGEMYTLEIAEDDGGARIFMASMTLARDGHVVTDALDHPRVRLAALPIKATTGIVDAGKLKAVKSDEERDALFEKLALEKIPSGTPKRAQQGGAVRYVISPLEILRLISSGILQAGKQMESDQAVFEPLRKYGVEFKAFSPDGIRKLVSDLGKFECLAALAGKRMFVTKDGRVLIGGTEYKEPLDFFKAQDLEHFLSKEASLQSHDRSRLPQAQFESRRQEILEALQQLVAAEGEERSEILRGIVDKISVLNDVLVSYLWSPNESIRKAAMEVYINNSYRSYEIENETYVKEGFALARWEYGHRNIIMGARRRYGHLAIFEKAEDVAPKFGRLLSVLENLPKDLGRGNKEDSLTLAFQYPVGIQEEDARIRYLANQLGALLNNSHQASLESLDVRRVTFLVHTGRSFLRYLTYCLNQKGGYDLDQQVQDMDPPLAYHMELNRMARFDTKLCSSSTHGVRVYYGEGRGSKESLLLGNISKRDSDRRLFSRALVGKVQGFLIQETENQVSFAPEVRKIFRHSLQSIDLVLSRETPNWNQIFLNVLPVVDTSISVIVEGIRSLITEHSKQLTRSRVGLIEILFHRGGKENLRFHVTGIGDSSPRIESYREVVDPDTRLTVLRSLDPRNLGSEEGRDIEDPYVELSPVEWRPWVAQSRGMMYVYDIPMLFQNQLSIGLNDVMHVDELVIVDGKMRPIDRTVGNNDIGFVGWRVTTKTVEHPEEKQMILVARDITFNDESPEEADFMRALSRYAEKNEIEDFWWASSPEIRYVHRIKKVSLENLIELIRSDRVEKKTQRLAKENPTAAVRGMIEGLKAMGADTNIISTLERFGGGQEGNEGGSHALDSNLILGGAATVAGDESSLDHEPIIAGSRVPQIQMHSNLALKLDPQARPVSQSAILRMIKPNEKGSSQQVVPAHANRVNAAFNRFTPALRGLRVHRGASLFTRIGR